MNDLDIERTAELANRAAGLAATALATLAQVALIPDNLVSSAVEQLDELANMLDNSGVGGDDYRAIARFVEASG